MLNALDCILDRRQDVEITVWSPKLPGPGPEWRNLVHKEAGHLSGNLWEQFELPFLSRGDPLFCPANTAPVLSLAGTQPVFVTIHDLSYAYFPEAYSRAFRLWYNLLIPLAMSRAEAILTVSETERASIIERFPSVAARIHVSQNGGWPRDILPDLDPRPVRDQSSVLYVGSLSKRKNFPAMLEIAIQLARKRGLRFRFVGGTAASLASSNQILPSDVEHLVRFEGQTDDLGKLAEYYHEAGCFLFPSLYESSGLPPVEAMACACPVIASDIPALRERCGDAAAYCDPTDPASIAATLEAVINSADRRSQMVEAGLRRCKQITWENCANSILDVISASLKPVS